MDITDLRSTIIPKSDQLNSEQLLGGPMVITVTEVRRSASEEQPLIVHYEGDNGRPFKPCKTMRKVLILAWGADGSRWAGHSAQLFNDPNVRFGGSAVGGIRISHMTGIDKPIEVSLTATKGKKALHRIEPLVFEAAPHIDDVLQAIAAATNKAGMDQAKALAERLTDTGDIEHAQIAYRARMAALRQAAAPAPTADASTEAPTT